MLVWLKRVILSAAILGLFATVAVQAQNAGNLGSGPGNGPSGGFRALSGAEAAFFVLPDNMDQVTSTRLGRYGLTYERYQQVFGGAKVLGGQLTLYRDDGGAVTTVIGAHYPNITATNSVRLTPAAARGIVDRDLGPEGRRITELMIDPRDGRYFFRVETRRPDSRWILWIGAQGGQLINKYNALAYEEAPPPCTTAAEAPCGYGVEHDTGYVPEDVKDLSGLITTDNSSEVPVYSMWRPDGRQGTYDQGSVTTPIWNAYPAVDTDNWWTDLGDVSPAQQALVDAHYYGNLTDVYLQDRHGFVWWDWARGDPYADYDFMAIAAHYYSNYNNATWNGDFVALGDGDQVTFRELTSLDVIVHELTHGVTDFTSNLIYQNESGALNEAFSDIMAASAEFYADDPDGDPETSDGLETPGLKPDWFVGEDIYIPEFGSAAPGFRNMADPEEDGSSLKPKYPDHYDDRYLGTGDNGGVHINSSIPNHAFYLLVEGGLNASCASTGDHESTHCTSGGIGADTEVTGIGIADAERVFFLAFTALNSSATMCDARAATEAIASTLFDDVDVSQQALSTSDAWVAVGLTDTVCPDSGPYDFTDPTVGFANPTDGAEVSGRVTIGIDALDNVGVALVQFYVDNRLICESATGTLSCTWNTKKVSLGQHTLLARAKDANGNVGDEIITVTVKRGGGGGGGNSKPTASFTYGCTDMDCDFDGSGSSDSDGTVVSYDWDFGDGQTATGAMADHTYAAGFYTVTLTVTDEAGESGSESQTVSVGDTSGALSLVASGLKVKGVQHADLQWGGASGEEVIVYRDGSLVATTNNDGAYRDKIGYKGGGSYRYQVCETATVESPSCSNQVEVVF